MDEDNYFVMDNYRNNSRDSRIDDLGVLQRSQIIGYEGGPPRTECTGCLVNPNYTCFAAGSFVEEDR